MNNITYKKEGINLQTVYTIEFIDNIRDLEQIPTHPAPWNLYKSKSTEDLQTAIEIFTALYAAQRDESRHIYDVKLFEEIKLNGETIREQYITDITGFIRTIGREADRINDKNNLLMDQAEAKENKLNAFLNKYNARKTWDQFHA